MVDVRLLQYIETQMQKGFSVQQLRYHLIKNGYNPAQVDEAIRHIYYNPTYPPQSVKHEIHVSKETVIAIAAMLLGVMIILGSFYYFISDGDQPKQLLDLKVSLSSYSVKAGEPLTFDLSLINLGNTGRYDVMLEYEIVDTDNTRIKFAEETIAIETKAATETSIMVPDDAKPGPHILKAVASYNGRIAKASESFQIIQDSDIPTCTDGIKNQGEISIDCGGPCSACPTCNDGIQNQGEEDIDCGGPCNPCEEEKECPASCDDGNACTEDSCGEDTGYECMHEKIEPCCGDMVCDESEKESCAEDCASENPFLGLNIFEQMDKIEALASSDLEKSAQYCNQINQEIYRDQCLLRIAKVGKTTKICDMMTATRSKDDCYTQVAKLLDDSTLCQTISKQSRIDACYSAFFMKGDYSVCDKIENSYLKQSCESLQKVAEMKTS